MLTTEHTGKVFKVTINDIYFEKYFIVKEDYLQTTAPCEVNLSIGGNLNDYLSTKNNTQTLTLTGNLNLAKALAEYAENAVIPPHVMFAPVLGQTLAQIAETLLFALRKSLNANIRFIKDSQKMMNYSAQCQKAIDQLSELEQRVHQLEEKI